MANDFHGDEEAPRMRLLGRRRQQLRSHRMRPTIVWPYWKPSNGGQAKRETLPGARAMKARLRGIIRLNWARAACATSVPTDQLVAGKGPDGSGAFVFARQGLIRF